MLPQATYAQDSFTLPFSGTNFQRRHFQKSSRQYFGLELSISHSLPGCSGAARAAHSAAACWSLALFLLALLPLSLLSSLLRSFLSFLFLFFLLLLLLGVFRDIIAVGGPALERARVARHGGCAGAADARRGRRRRRRADHLRRGQPAAGGAAAIHCIPWLVCLHNRPNLAACGAQMGACDQR